MYHGPLELAYEATGIERFCLALYDDPTFVRDLLDRRTGFVLSLAKRAVALGCEYVIVGDDCAFKNAPLISPADYERFVLPCYERIIGELDVPVVLHTDGYVTDLLPMIRDVGFRGVHALEPVAGVDLGEVKKRFGEDLVLMGNVDCGDVLCKGSLEDVRREVDRCMRQAKAGGRYVLCSSNCLHDGVKAANAGEMFRYAREVGRYG